jgi:DNA invertase Pin-like site-specific DNA recombinase
MPIAYGYCRVSTEAQARSGLGIEAQQAQIQLYHELRLNDTHQFGGFYSDPAESGRVPFLSRIGAAQLSGVVRPGDAVIIAKLDRGFRSLRDCLETEEYLRKDRGISLHLMDLNVDTTTAAGRMVLQMMGSVAEFESNRISERTKEAMARKRARGEWWGRRPPYPYRYHRRADGKLTLKMDQIKRKVGRQLYDWWAEGYTFKQICQMAEEQGLKAQSGYKLATMTVWDWIQGEKALRIAEQFKEEHGIEEGECAIITRASLRLSRSRSGGLSPDGQKP